MNKKNIALLLIALQLLAQPLMAAQQTNLGKVSVGTPTAVPASSTFEINSTTRGSRPCPPMTTAQRTAISSPSTGLCVYDTDTKGYWQYNSTAWAQIGSGGSGGGGTQYLTDDSSNIDNSIGSWLAYADAAGTQPVDATGGAPTVTCTRSTSSPLHGTASMLITKDAANRQGNGCSVAITIGAEHSKGTSIWVDADYSVSSGTYADDDISWWAYDGTSVYPIAIKNSGASSGMATCASGSYCHMTGYFVTGSGSTTYTLAAHVASTSASAYTIKADDIRFAVRDANMGSIVTQPVAYTPTFTGLGTVSAINFTSWRNGAYLFVEGTFTAGTTTATEARISLGFNGVDSSVTTVSTLPTISRAGEMSTNDTSSATFYGGYSILEEASKAYMTVGVHSSSGSSLTKTNGSSCCTSNKIFSLKAHFPISGWAANTTLSSSTNNGVTQSVVTASSHSGGFSANSSGTYTPPAGAKWIEVIQVGGGGGGSGSGTAGGTVAGDGGDTTFGTSLITAGKGLKGVFSSDLGGAGGTGTVSAPAFGYCVAGGTGAGYQYQVTGSAGDYVMGGVGGSSAFGGPGVSSSGGGASASGSAASNTGSGGGGAANPNLSASFAGTGGGAGSTCWSRINNPGASYLFAVGAAGSAGGAGTGSGAKAGGAGASGQIIVNEYYVSNGTVAQDSITQNNGSEGAGTTTLTSGSIRNQLTTLTAARTYAMPSSGVLAGDRWSITNNGDFALTVQSSGANTIAILNVGTINLMAAVNNPTAKADWIVQSIRSKTTWATTFSYVGGSGGTTSGSINLTVERNGNTVTFYNPGAVSTSGTSNTHYDNNTAIPLGYRPAAQTVFFAITRNNASGAAGLMLLNNSGTFGLYRDYGATAYSNTTSCGYQEELHGSFYSAL